MLPPLTPQCPASATDQFARAICSGTFRFVSVTFRSPSTVPRYTAAVWWVSSDSVCAMNVLSSSHPAPFKRIPSSAFGLGT